VLASRKVAAKFTTRTIWVAASALTSGSYDLQHEISRNQLEEVAGKQAFEMAGIGPQDLDLAKVVWHLRGEAGERQVQGAKAGLAHCSGGGVASDTPACCVQILKR
jgi:acetyl-CoA acetyltransferase